MGGAFLFFEGACFLGNPKGTNRRFLAGGTVL